jgi:hypothetical protein
MKIEYKSMSIGVTLGVIGVLFTLFLFGNIETEFSFNNKNPDKEKKINVTIEKIIKNGIETTNVNLKGSGELTKQDLDKELERLLDENGIDKNDSNINIELTIEN